MRKRIYFENGERIIKSYTEAEWNKLFPATPQDVNDEREVRIRNGKAFKVAGYGSTISAGCDEKTRAELRDQKDDAKERIELGHDELMPWRDRDNVIHWLSPEQMVGLWRLVTAYVRDVHIASWAIKDDKKGISANFAKDKHWPK